MDEISKYDIALFLDQYNLSIVDAYINNDEELIMEIEEDNHFKNTDREMILAELEESFSLFKNVSHDDSFEKFIVELNSQNTMLVD